MTIEEMPHRLEQDGRGHLAVNNISFSQAGSDLLTDIAFEARPGSVTVVVGAISEARAVLLELLLGLRRPSSGTVSVDGAAMVDLAPSVARSRVTIALPDPWLTAGTVAENIAFGLRRVDRVQIENAARLACVTSFTKNWQLGLDTMISDEGSNLSAGQRRLVALARAVVRDPAVLLIDEPIKGLSPGEESTAIRAIRQVSEGRTVVVATERATMAQEGDQIIEFDGGCVGHHTARRPDPDTAPDLERHRANRRLGAPQSAGSKLLATVVGQELAVGFEAVSFVEQTTHT